MVRWLKLADDNLNTLVGSISYINARSNLLPFCCSLFEREYKRELREQYETEILNLGELRVVVDSTTARKQIARYRPAGGNDAV